VHLLPVYDEYLVAYRDRVAVPHASAVMRSARVTTFQHALVIDGQVAGTWKAVRGADGVGVAVSAIRSLTKREQRGVDDALARYGRFLGAPVSRQS
jgi:hypothetical protein